MIVRLAEAAGIDLLDLSHRQLGLLKYATFRQSGELYLAKRVIPTFLPKFEPVLFDIGAHDGSYSSLLAASVPNSLIYSFEPNPHAAEKLRISLTGDRYRIFEQGFSDKAERRELYIFPGELASPYSTVYRDIFDQIHQTGHESILCNFDTLDHFCEVNRVPRIDFLKIDVEGHELSVLRGAEKMIAARSIHMIQFEFSEMNVISRSYLHDFFDLLTGYRIFRLDSHQLIPIRKYEPRWEIFRYQNFFAIKEELAVKS